MTVEQTNGTGGSDPLLAVEGLTTRFDITAGIFGAAVARVHAVEDISFSLAPGETLALVGESGCGKSTTGRSILRLDRPTAGSVQFAGQELTTLSTKDLQPIRRNIQMIFQDPFASLNPRITAGAAIADGKELDDIVVDLLQKVGLGREHYNRFPHEFSGGQRQRICIARALGLGPKLIIADEAVSALDVTIQAQVINLMMDLQKELGLSYLFISHDMAVVERISHRVAVMYLGRIVEIGPRAAIFENPQHSYTKKLLNAVPVADPTYERPKRELMSDEIPSAARPLDYVPGVLDFKEVGKNHMVAIE